MSRTSTRRLSSLLRTGLAEVPAVEPDPELLGRFARSGDESAFAELVSRHGGLVRAAARRQLGDAHAAEDVFQAAFLLLARKAGTQRWHGSVGPWLYAAALRLAAKARCRQARAASTPLDADRLAATPDPTADLAWEEVRRALDEELARLPARLREPLVLCFLQGRTRDEAARSLGWSLGTLKRRLERGRNILRDRLTGRGLSLGTAGAGVLLLDPPVSATAARSLAAAAARYSATGIASPAALALLSAPASTVLTRLGALLAATAVVFGAGAFALSGEGPVAVEKQGDPKELPPTQAQSGASARTDVLGDPLPAGAVMRLGSTRLRPAGIVERMAFSPDGKKIAAWADEMYVTRTLTVWDTETGRLLRRVELPGAAVLALSWLADGRGVALVRGEDQAKPPVVWEFTDERATPDGLGAGQIRKMNAVPGAKAPAGISCYAFGPDGKTLAVGVVDESGQDERIVLTPLKVGATVGAPERGKELGKQPGGCERLLYTPDGRTLVAFSKSTAANPNKTAEGQLVIAWDVANGRERARFTAPVPAANGDRIAAAVSNQTLAIGLEKGDTSLWDLDSGKERRLATGHDSKREGGGYGTYAVAFTPDGKTLATGGRDNIAKLWDVATGKQLHTLSRHYSWVETLATSPDGKFVASSGQDGVIRLWDAATGVEVCRQPGHKYTVLHAALTPDGKTAITAGLDNSIRWWDLVSGRETRAIEISSWVGGLTLSPDGKTLLATNLSGPGEGSIRTWDVASGRDTTPPDLPADARFEKLAFTPDGKSLIAAAGPVVSVWEWPALRRVRTIELPKPAKQPGENHCQWVAVSPDGRWLATVAQRTWERKADGLRYGYGADGVVDVWEIATGKRFRRLAESEGCFRSATYTADGRLVIAGASGAVPTSGGHRPFQNSVNLLDPVAGRWVRSFTEPPAAPNVSHRYHMGAVLSADGRTLYLGYNTGEVVGFEVATGKPRRTVGGHRGFVAGLGASADGRRLISGGQDGTALIWDTTLAAGGMTPAKTEAESPEKLWDALSGPDAGVSGDKMAELARAPETAVELFRSKLRPAPAAPSDADLERLFQAMDGKSFAAREKASRDLAAFGESAVPGVRKRLEREASAEVRQRAEAFLARFDPPELSAERLREIRAVEVLEGIASPAARKVLAEIAAGAASAPLTEDAAAALKRLARE